MRYWKRCLQAPLTRPSPAPCGFHATFRISRCAFLTILEPGTDCLYCRKICFSSAFNSQNLATEKPPKLRMSEYDVLIISESNEDEVNTWKILHIASLLSIFILRSSVSSRIACSVESFFLKPNWCFKRTFSFSRKSLSWLYTSLSRILANGVVSNGTVIARVCHCTSLKDWGNVWYN